MFFHAGCPADFQYLPEASGCYKIVLQSLTWTQSQARCPQLDPRAHLAVITNAQQNNAIVNYTKSLDQAGEQFRGYSFNLILSSHTIFLAYLLLH